MKKTIQVTYYECPVCGYNHTDRQKVYKHFTSHPIKVNEIVYCKICGAGWNVKARGKEAAIRKAEECFQKHQEEGNIDEVATEAFFLSHGAFGYVRKVET
ncbi:hypothetical protein [Anaerocolumna xylanovorans]|uniref:C2H2-type domain-containing protein n=1 Tax=Anaerocolumna xylanovorans DSM 12503 TaxID=1121345 RepID=A0A1M7YBU6_9FIRM|nr:hypothetical protein [Anaerocolumna xylanovorans]SHO50110.1 hypothetical protein SAMN02745217_02591 [Anaerocolumna xylanovorans DSM 12503]